MLVAPLSTSNTYVRIAVGEIAEEVVGELEVVKAFLLFQQEITGFVDIGRLGQSAADFGCSQHKVS